MAEHRSGPRRNLKSKVSKKSSTSRKKRRVKLKWGPVFWLLFVIQLGAGLIWSPVTSPHMIYVRGCGSHDESRVVRQIQSINGYPFIQVPAGKLESLIMNNSSIKSCQLKINIFGRGSLNIQQREPIARLDGYKNFYVDSEGVLFVLPSQYKMLPIIKIADNLKVKNFAISGSWESQKSAALCSKFLKWLPGRPFILEVDSRGLVSIDLQGLTKVFLGSYDNMEEKFDVLSQWLERDEEMLRKSKLFNLSVPKFPTYIP